MVDLRDMGKVLINKQGLAEPPVYPCNKGEGLCDLRTMDTDKFQCVYSAGTCNHRKVSKIHAPSEPKPDSQRQQYPGGEPSLGAAGARVPVAPEAKSEEDETSKQWDSLGRGKEKGNATVPSVQREGDHASPT